VVLAKPQLVPFSTPQVPSKTASLALGSTGASCHTVIFPLEEGVNLYQSPRKAVFSQPKTGSPNEVARLVLTAYDTPSVIGTAPSQVSLAGEFRNEKFNTLAP